MYRMVIADDEEAVRRCLINDVPWEQYGFQVCGEAANGAQALELVEKLKPHLLLTDIRMDNINGLSVLERVNSSFPATQVVILSAYSLFEYAQQAVLYSAAGYLIKPIERDQLERVLIKVRQQIENGPMFSGDGAAPSLNQQSSTDAPPQDTIALACEYIRAHYAERLTLKQVASVCFVHPAHLSRQFRVRCNTTYSDYLAQVRIERACSMLCTSVYRINEIALKCGYDDYSYFCRVFRKIVGVTPLEYRCNPFGGDLCDE